MQFSVREARRNTADTGVCKKKRKRGGSEVESAEKPSKPRMFELVGPIPVDLDRFRDFDFSTFRTGLSQHFFSKIGPGKPESGTRKSEIGI